MNLNLQALIIKDHSDKTQQSVVSGDSSVDCVNTEIGIFLSLCDNATAWRTPQCQKQLVWMSLYPGVILILKFRNEVTSTVLYN